MVITMKGLALALLITLVDLPVHVSALGLRHDPALRKTVGQETKALKPEIADHGQNSSDIGMLDGIFQEDIDDAQFWKTGKPPTFSELGGYHLPPKCPSDHSENSAYFQEMVYPNKVHTICDYRQPCNKKGTNLERLKSIRGLLAATKSLLDGNQVPYALYQGSAIGQHRCGDVLPWDADCDVVVWMEDAHKIPPGDLAWPYTVRHNKQNSAIPFVVADKTTGFYCDIFFMHKVGNNVGMAWPWSPRTCSVDWAKSTSYPFNHETKHCHYHDADLVTPFVPCYLNGIQHMCFKDQAAYLTEYYGPSVLTVPNVSTELLQGM